MYVFSVALHPGCAADHGYALAPATLGFGAQPLRGKESDRSTSDDALDEESLTALGVGREMRQRFEGEGAKQWQL